MGRLFLWPVVKFWECTPYQWVCRVAWNISELTRIPLPFAPYFFRVIVGKSGNAVMRIKR